MSDKRKQYLAEQIVKASNLSEQVALFCVSMRGVLTRDYPHLSVEEMELVWKKYDLSFYLDKIIELYCDHFSEEELKTIVDFYLSPAGQKTVRGSFIQSLLQFNSDWAQDIRSECQSLEHEKIQA